MEQFLSIKREFAELLAGQFSPYGVRVTGEFPSESHRRPGGCALAVGIDGVGFPSVPSSSPYGSIFFVRPAIPPAAMRCSSCSAGCSSQNSASGMSTAGPSRTIGDSMRSA